MRSRSRITAWEARRPGMVDSSPTQAASLSDADHSGLLCCVLCFTQANPNWVHSPRLRLINLPKLHAVNTVSVFNWIFQLYVYKHVRSGSTCSLDNEGWNTRSLSLRAYRHQSHGIHETSNKSLVANWAV
eukprot:364283-Chlamydomonas_euryale.AAC.20